MKKKEEKELNHHHITSCPICIQTESEKSAEKKNLHTIPSNGRSIVLEFLIYISFYFIL